jgi:pimeloyl-ACP methyl ester carboxylesterase
MPDGTSVVLRRHGNPSGPRIVFSHGNGLAADLYYPLWSLLTDRFDLILHDLRNHGWNPVWERRTHNFPAFVSDNQHIAAVIAARFGKKPLIGVFHSASGISALLSQMADRRSFAGLALLDLPLCPPGQSPGDLAAIGDVAAQRARQRITQFDRRQDLTKALSRSRSFRLIPAETLELFGRTTLRASPSGGYELCCPPEYEAQIYEYGFGWAIQLHDTLERQGLSCPVKAIGSDPTMPYSFMPAMDLSNLVAMDYDFIPRSTHFLPLEFPEECAAMIVEFLDEHGLT